MPESAGTIRSRKVEIPRSPAVQHQVLSAWDGPGPLCHDVLDGVRDHTVWRQGGSILCKIRYGAQSVGHDQLQGQGNTWLHEIWLRWAYTMERAPWTVHHLAHSEAQIASPQKVFLILMQNFCVRNLPIVPLRSISYHGWKHTHTHKYTQILTC